MSILLINTTTRNAFYEIQRVKNSVVCRWGALGTIGQRKVDRFANLRSAQAFIDDKVFKKTELGDYVRVA
jgi:predicted DNA-binding WGR domain protein